MDVGLPQTLVMVSKTDPVGNINIILIANF
jgi:hypothetical protein